MSRLRVPVARMCSIWGLVTLVLLTTAHSASAGPDICRNIDAPKLELQQNLHASALLVKCGIAKGGSPNPLAVGAQVSPFSLSGSDVNVITGEDTYPRVTQSESFVWSNGNTIVVAYNDSRGDAEVPPNYSGISVSHDGGATFTRLGPQSPLSGHGANWGDPVVVYNARLQKWFAGDLTGGCGGQGIGMWSSTTGDTWTLAPCAHVGTEDDRESMWVDNNPGSPFYGRMYISFNDFAELGNAKVVYSDNGTSWSAPVLVVAAFFRDIQLTGSPGADGRVFLALQHESSQHIGATIQSYMASSTNGGKSWALGTMGSQFQVPGRYGCNGGNTPPTIPPNWRQSGYGQPAAGPNGVLHYVYAAFGVALDEGDIWYIRSTNNGATWEKPIRLNTDPMGSKAQWMPSLRVTPSGVVEASWYDRRNTTDGSNYQRYVRVSTNNGVTWGPDEALSTGMIPQPAQPDPLIQSCYAGDYNYATATGSTGLDTWTDGRVPANKIPSQKVFFHAIPLP